MQYLDPEFIEVDSKFVGTSYVNTKDLEFTIVNAYRKKTKNSYSYKYKIVFNETRYETFASKSDINKGLVKDKLTPVFSGVGMMGYGTVKGNINKKEYSVWTSMLSRCYEKNNDNYHRYGQEGVTVCDRWMRFDYFLEDFKNIDGYDINLIADNKLFLDKDKKQIHLPKSSRVYSKDTCCFITKEENDSYRDLKVVNNIRIIATRLEEKIEFNSLREFCRYSGVKPAMASIILKKSSEHKGWTLQKL